MKESILVFALAIALSSAFVPDAVIPATSLLRHHHALTQLFLSNNKHSKGEASTPESIQALEVWCINNALTIISAIKSGPTLLVLDNPMCVLASQNAPKVQADSFQTSPNRL